MRLALEPFSRHCRRLSLSPLFLLNLPLPMTAVPQLSGAHRTYTLFHRNTLALTNPLFFLLVVDFEFHTHTDTLPYMLAARG